MLAWSYELLSVALYFTVFVIAASREPQKNHLSIIAATPFIFLSECLILSLMAKYFQRIEIPSLVYEYSSDFGMLYDRIPWVLPFLNGWFWGIPLLICYKLHEVDYQKENERMEILYHMEEIDETERVKRARELLQSMKTQKTSWSGFFLPCLIFMGWDILVECLAIRGGLWSYPYGSFTIGGLPLYRFFVVGFTGLFLVMIDGMIIGTLYHKRTLRQMQPLTQTLPDVKERSWVRNISLRIIGYNITFLLSFMFFLFSKA